MRKIAFTFYFSLSTFLLFSQVWKPLSPLLYACDGPAFIQSLAIYNNKLILHGAICKIGNNVLPQPSIGSWGSPLTWDGNVYDTISGLSRFYGLINSFAEFNGKLYCGGSFGGYQYNTGIGSIPNTNYIARYNGTNMEALATVTPSNSVRVLKAKNYLYIGGLFYYIGGTPYRAIAKYDGTSYSTVGGGMYGMNPAVSSMTVYNNEIIVGGSFDGTQGLVSPGFVAWNGTSWHKLILDYIVSPIDLITDSINNFLYVASFERSTDTSSGMKRWDGYNWNDLLLPSASVAYGQYAGTKSGAYSLCMYKKELYAALMPIDTINFLDSTLWHYDGVQWHNITGIGNSTIYNMCVYNDDLYIGGAFTKAGNDSVNGIVALHMNEPSGCNWLIPRVFTNADTFYLATGQAQVQFYNNNAYANSWQWDFGDTGIDNIKSPLHSYSQTGTYIATVTVTEDGCTKTAQKTITVLLGNSLEEYTKENLNFKLYPNPTTGDITVELTLPELKPAELKAFSNSGTLQESYILKKGYNKVEINSSAWTNGLSLIGVYIEGKQVFVEKVVKLSEP